MTADLTAGLDPIEVRHFYVRNDEIGLKQSAMLDELNAIFSYRNDLMAEPGQYFLKEVAHFGFIVCDRDSQARIHASPVFIQHRVR